MRVVVTGATGNVGTSVVPALLSNSQVTSVTGVARRVAGDLPFPGVDWKAADVGRDRLDGILRGADALVHLAWAIQPSHDEPAMWQTNVLGSRAVFDSAARSGVGIIIYASSIGAYGRGPADDRPVDESWAVEGTPSSYYGRHKAEVEWFLDGFELAHPQVRVVRLRPSLIFKKEAASEIRGLFIGPLVPRRVFHPGTLPFFPDAGLRFQAVHSDDVAHAFQMALTHEVRGPFNLAADPLLTMATVAEQLDASAARIPFAAARAAAAVSWMSRLQPTAPGWLDMAARVPIMDTGRARSELGWRPTHTSGEALAELLEGLREGVDFPTPPLAGGRHPLWRMTDAAQRRSIVSDRRERRT